MLREDVYKLIDSERDYQDRKWGAAHDEHESIGNFLIYIERYVERAKDALVDYQGEEAAMDVVRKVTALGVAAMELFGAPGRGEEESTQWQAQ